MSTAMTHDEVEQVCEALQRVEGALLAVAAAIWRTIPACESMSPQDIRQFVADDWLALR